MSDEIQQFLGELTDDGTQAGDTTSFTLRSDKAREKLKKFALAHPENYFLLIVACLHTLGARHFRLKVDADDLEVFADCSLERTSLKKLWAHVAGGATSQDAVGLRLLALAILTSVRFGKANWTVEVAETAGTAAFSFQQVVKNGDLPEVEFGNEVSISEGCRVWVKRKSLGQVAARFFSRLKDKLTKSQSLEEKLIASRLFLGFFDSFELNGLHLDCTLETQRALALLRVGGDSGFLSARLEHTKNGERPMTVILTPLENELSLPGEQGQIHWLWHGLSMGSTDLNVHSKFARVFVSADGMNTDLSLTAIPDTWARQKVVRAARQAVRDLIQELALDFTKRFGRDLQGHDMELEDILLEVLGERIDVSRSRHRLAKFNTILIQCPLFNVNDADGETKRWTLGELWERLEEGEQLAVFRDGNSVDVPAWPGRPLVVETRLTHLRALERVFGARPLISARRLAERLEKLSQTDNTPVETKLTLVNEVNPWSGYCQISELTAEWDFHAGDMSVLLVTRQGKLLFKDGTLDLPSGFRFLVEADWKPNYEGHLSDSTLRAQLPRLALNCMVERLEKSDGPPTPKDLAATVAVWSFLGGDPQKWPEESLLKRRWCVATENNPEGTGFRWITPAEFLSGPSPLFYLGLGALEDYDRSIYEDPCLVIEKDVAEQFEAELVSARGLALAQRRTPFELNSETHHIFTYDHSNLPSLDSRLAAISVCFPKKGASSDQKAHLHCTIKDGTLLSRSFLSFVAPVEVRQDWTQGYPDERGLYFLDKEQSEASRLLAIDAVKRACKELMGLPWDDFLLTDEAARSTCWFECWTDEKGQHLPLFWNSDGKRRSASQIKSTEGPVAWYSDPRSESEQSAEAALWVPADVFEMLEGELEWRHFMDEPQEQDSRKAEEVTQDFGAPAGESLSNEISVDAPVPRTTPLEALPRPDEKNDIPPPRELASPEVVAKIEKRPSVPEPVKAVTHADAGSRAHRFTLALQSEVDQLAKLGKIPHLREFEHYISRLPWTERGITCQLVEGIDLPTKSLETLFSQPRHDQILILLSALYSIFNRELELVEDKDERKFQKIVNKRAVKLFGRGPL